MSKQRLVLPLNLLAPLGDADRPHLAQPWHDTETDRDAVTNGAALLVWNGQQFAPRPAGDEAPPPPIAFMLEPCASIGSTTLGAILEWVDDRVPHCRCGGAAMPLRCSTCGEAIRHDRPGLFYGIIISRGLLGLYLRPLRKTQPSTTPVEVRNSGIELSPVYLVAASWTLVVMPQRPGPVEGPAFGETVEEAG